MKKFLKYIVTFIIVLVILVSFLVITAIIPKEIIAENVKKSKRCFETTEEVNRVIEDKEYTYLHSYADAILLNITYNLDEKHPLKSVIEDKYNKEYIGKYIFNYNFERLVEDNKRPNTQYLRYWHGTVGILKILLIFMDMGEIYIFNAIILTILLIILLILLFRNRAISLGISLIVSLIITVSLTVPFCLEYTWTYYIMLITSILAVIFKNHSQKLNMLFFITGMITCFLDFLSTEIITIAVPLLIIFVLKLKDEQITNGKEALELIFKSLFLWGTAYILMWFTKWIIASIVLNINAFMYVKWDAKKRINGKIMGIKKNELWWYAIKRNILTLYPLNLQKGTLYKLIVIPIVLIIIKVILIGKRNLKKLWIPGAILFIGILPYIRYAILSNHSYTHFFFTFRSQIVTIMSIFLIITTKRDAPFSKKLTKRDTPI